MNRFLIELASIGFTGQVLSLVAGAWCADRLHHALSLRPSRALSYGFAAGPLWLVAIALGVYLMPATPFGRGAVLSVAMVAWIAVNFLLARRLLKISWSQAGMTTIVSLAIFGTPAGIALTAGQGSLTYIVPTGAMSPTIAGRHIACRCPQCTYTFDVGASMEADRERQQRYERHENVVVSAICPQCGYEVDTETLPRRLGDSIFVDKWAYRGSDPQRWDIAVFRYPLHPSTNYVKRVVGLPGETVRISGGDLFVRTGEQKKWRILRKTPAALEQLIFVVHDSDHRSSQLERASWPEAWQPAPRTSKGNSPEAWRATNDGRAFETAPTKDPVWLWYQNYVPSKSDWRTAEKGEKIAVPRPQLIRDNIAYNNSVTGRRGIEATAGRHWVGDMLLDAEFVVDSDEGRLLLGLIEGGRRHECDIEIGTGRARLSISGMKDFHPSGQIGIRKRGTYRLRFANVDNKLHLWLAGQPVKFDGRTSFTVPLPVLPQASDADPGDLAPVRLGAQGAKVSALHIKVLRDVYYIADRVEFSSGFTITDYETGMLKEGDEREVAEFISDPALWKSLARSGEANRRSFDFPLLAGQFFVLGDNSPSSKDARLWQDHQYLERELFLGKAVGIYTPRDRFRDLAPE